MKALTSLKQVEGNIQGFILSIVGVAVVLAVGLIVLVNLQYTAGTTGGFACKDGLHTIINTTNGELCHNATSGGGSPGTSVASSAITTIAGNATKSVITQMATVPQWIGIIITVALAFIVLGYFYNRM
jgi:hypothetical protein